MMNTNTTTATVDELTTRRAEQRKAHAAALHAYGPGSAYTFDDIRAAYVKPSAAKRAAWESVKRLCASFNGSQLRITARTCHFFSAVFQYVEQATGALCYCYITRDYVRHCYA